MTDAPETDTMSAKGTNFAGKSGEKDGACREAAGTDSVTAHETNVERQNKKDSGRLPGYIEVDGVVYPVTVRCDKPTPVEKIVEKLIKNAVGGLEKMPETRYNTPALIGLDHREEDENGFDP